MLTFNGQTDSAGRSACRLISTFIDVPIQQGKETRFLVIHSLQRQPESVKGQHCPFRRWTVRSVYYQLRKWPDNAQRVANGQKEIFLSPELVSCAAALRCHTGCVKPPRVHNSCVAFAIDEIMLFQLNRSVCRHLVRCQATH